MTEVQQTEKVTPRLKTKYRDEIRGALQEQFQYGNVMQVPGLVKVVVNMGVGEAAKDSKIIDGAVAEMVDMPRVHMRGIPPAAVGRYRRLRADRGAGLLVRHYSVVGP